ncbi:MAG: SLC13 family permease [Phenylobacterium sp.]|uniref:SLC13 family permease n=1 Tax=Phenylobacterium sp. TaxID=1871053 RepID=UPI0025CD0C39|nr:SLC13 family permease [Phenylobacterium sp.]MBI1200574.1 SLC13 family permease [Phenylobacterium sp.]
MELPTLHAAAAMLIAVVTFWLFADGRMRIEIVSLLLIATLALLFNFFPIEREGYRADIELAFGGFGHEALVAICCLMILGRGLVVTGALEPVALFLTALWRRSPLLGLLVSLVLGAVMSMIVNDTPVLVLVMPILLNLAARTDVPASKTLMPMNCAILIGGMATTIGTSTNLLVVSISEDLGLPRFGVFDFTGVALLAGLVALPYLWLVMPRLLPEHSAAEELLTRRFRGALHLTEGSSAIGQTMAQLRERLDTGVVALGLVRRGVELYAADIPLEPDDVVAVEGAAEQLRQSAESLKAPLAHPAVLKSARSISRASGEDEVVAELAVGADSNLIGQSARSAQIADRYGVTVIGLFKPDRTLLGGRARPSVASLETGDVLLVQGADSALRRLQIEEGAMVLEGAAELPRTAKSILAVAIFVASVVPAALHLVPIAISSLAGAIAMLATGCVKFDRVGRALSAKVIVLVAASIALGRALLETGAAEWLGGGMALAMQSFPPAAVLAAMMAFAALLTNFSSNTAAAAVGTPIAVSLSASMGVPPQPLVLAVLFGCNLCYATPVAYQTNILIMSAGGYQFRDYVRAGLPLVLLMIVTLSVLLVWKYGL